jgi:hypothetical protein
VSRLLTLIVGALLVGGCAAPGLSVPPGSPSGTTTSSAPAPKPVADPTAISIPKIGARSDLIALGLNPDGSLQVPPVDWPGLGGWYAGADSEFPGDEIQPGERGGAVVAAHVDGVINGQKGQPGLFFRLHQLEPGDEIFIDQVDGGRLRFLVDRVETHSKDRFPTDSVYGPTDRPELRLVTCGGTFSRASGHYLSNVIVFASLAPEQL